jgi:hypothetical protein
MDDTWEDVARFLTAVENRYRRDRLRIGPDAKRLDDDEEAAVALKGALSLEDGVTDCRDTYLAVRCLSEIAAKHGIDLRTIEQEIAALSSTRMRTLLETRSLDMCDFA